MERTTRARLLTVCAALAGLATSAAAQQITATLDRALARLEARVAANPNNVKALTAVGVKLYDLQRFAESRAPLEKARELDPRNGVAALYAGLAAEKTQDYVAARAAYTKYLQVGKTGKTKKEVQARLFVVAKEELKQSAKLAAQN